MMQIIERREKNKLIAEFMGAKYVGGMSSESNDPMYHFDTKPSFHPDHWHTFDFQIVHMLYDSSWDWLMPVVDKIESLGFNTHIVSINTHIVNIKSGKKCLMHIYNFDGFAISETGKNKIEIVYTNVVKFIKWYNENKEEIK